MPERHGPYLTGTQEVARLLWLQDPRWSYADHLDDVERSMEVEPWVNSPRTIRPQLRWILLAKPCVYCGAKATCIDHMVPVARGGTAIDENLVPACQPCNGQKSDRIPWEWRHWRLERGLCWPPRQSDVEEVA